MSCLFGKRRGRVASCQETKVWIGGIIGPVSGDAILCCIRRLLYQNAHGVALLLLLLPPSGTPVHWAVLNGHLEALATLLRHGCSPNPPVPKKNCKKSSIAAETPMELCERLYGSQEGIGSKIRELLAQAGEITDEAGT